MQPTAALSDITIRPQDTGWVLAEQPDSMQITQLSEQAGLHPLVAYALAQHNITTAEQTQAFLYPNLSDLPDPFLMKGMHDAVVRLETAIAQQELIVVAGDYDVDGVTGTAVLAKFLRTCGAQVQAFVPNRFAHGYGLNADSLEALLSMKPQIVMTVDHGISALNEVAQLQAAGVDTIITDHHLPNPQGVPAGIIINPQQADCGYPHTTLSGCGVAFKVASALRKHLRTKGYWKQDRDEPNLKAYLDLVAIGALADMVPLVGENRVLVYYGLQVLNESPCAGLDALIDATPGLRKPNGYKPITEKEIGFRISPALNAPGRIADAGLSVQLLLSDDPTEASRLASEVVAVNLKRRKMSEEIRREAASLVKSIPVLPDTESPNAIVLASHKFHEGILGPLASQLAKQFEKPALVLAPGKGGYRGSARSWGGVNVTEAMVECKQWLQAYGGHAMAAGCSVTTENLPQLSKFFPKACIPQANSSKPQIAVAALLHPEQLNAQLSEQWQRLGPFGMSNEPLYFGISTNHLSSKPIALGKNHLKWHLSDSASLIEWKGADKPAWQGYYLVNLQCNGYAGRSTIDLVVVDRYEYPPQII